FGLLLVQAVELIKERPLVGGEIDKTENSLRRYVMRMGVDPALVDAAAKIPSRTFRGLSRGEIERFGIETRGVYETPWVAFHGPAGDFFLLKSVTYPTGDTGDQYRTRPVGFACSPFPSSIRFMYHQELTAKESRPPPMIRAKIGDSLIDLPTLNSQKDLVVHAIMRRRSCACPPSSQIRPHA